LNIYPESRMLQTGKPSCIMEGVSLGSSVQ
jgi:hypothetical protein